MLPPPVVRHVEVKRVAHTHVDIDVPCIWLTASHLTRVLPRFYMPASPLRLTVIDGNNRNELLSDANKVERHAPTRTKKREEKKQLRTITRGAKDKVEEAYDIWYDVTTRGDHALDKKDYIEAIRCLKRSFDMLLLPVYTDPRTCKIAYSLGDSFLGLTDWTNAIGWYKIALRSPPPRPHTHDYCRIDLAYAYIKSGDVYNSICTMSDIKRAKPADASKFISSEENGVLLMEALEDAKKKQQETADENKKEEKKQKEGTKKTDDSVYVDDVD